MFKKIYINISKQPLVYKISFILIISFILRFLFAIIMYHYGGGENTFIDDWDYIAIAKNILSQGIMLRDLSLLPSNSYVVGIGYPLIVSFFIKFFQDNYFPLIIINVIISTSTVYIIFLLGKEVFSEKIGLYSASWSTFYILFYQYLPRVHKAVAVQMLVPLTLLLIIKESKNNSISLKSIFPILIYSYLIHTDERYLFIFSFNSIN